MTSKAKIKARTLAWRNDASSVCSVDVSPDGRFVAAGGLFDDAVRVWDWVTGEVVADRAGLLRSPKLDYIKRSTTVRFSRDGTHLLARAGARTFEFAVDDWRPVERKDMRVPDKWKTSNALATGAKGTVAVDCENTAHCFEPGGKPIVVTAKSQENLSMLGFSPDGKLLIVCAKPPEVFHVKSGRRKCVLKVPKINGHAVAATWASWLPDGRHIVVAHSNTLGVGIYDVATGTLLNQLNDAPNRWTYRSNWCVSVNPVGDYVATTRENDQTVRVWRVSDNALEAELKGHAPSNYEMNDFQALRCLFAPDGSLVVNAGLKKLGGAVTIHGLGEIG